jgi:glycosyltransferase involved in cell wall biosynthesis
MRILICNWKDLRHPLAGGAEVYTHECAKRWAEVGHEVTLICAAIANEPELDTRGEYRIIRRGSRFGVYPAVARYLRDHHREYDVIIDEINTRPFFAHHHAGSTPVVALAHQVAREVWFHEMPLPVALAGRFVFEPMWLHRYAHVPTLTVSKSSADSLATYGLRNVSVVLEGVELPTAVELPIAKAAKPTLAFVGRLVSTKRPDHAIAAFAKAAKQLGEGAELHVIGTGPLEQRLRESAPPGVIIHGSVGQREKFEIIGRAHALLCTSRREGWGLVVSEAAAVGTPTIGYDVDGLRDSVMAARGVIVKADTDSLASAIAEWVPKFRANQRPPLPYGGAASWDDVATSVLVHLKAVVSGTAQPASVADTIIELPISPIITSGSSLPTHHVSVAETFATTGSPS